MAAPGGSSSTQRKAIQAKDAGDDGGSVQRAAAQGISGSASSLPHLDAIQRSFGHHDVSGVMAHTDSYAAAGASAMGAEAYATGDHVAFGSAPSLHTAAHEAAHVIQQRGGVQLKGGVGAVGDPYERHADAVADRVAAGQSAEALLDQHGGPSHGTDGSVQRQAEPIASIQMRGNFVPQIPRVPLTMALLNDPDTTVTYRITNGRSAPPGTTFAWGVEGGGADFAPFMVNPATGTEVRISTRPLRVAHVNVQPTLTMTIPGESAQQVQVPVWQLGVVLPTVDVTTRVVPGATGGGTGPDNLKPSDTLQIRAQFGEVVNPEQIVTGLMPFLLVQTGDYVDQIGSTVIHDDTPFQARDLRWENSTLVQEVYCHHAGSASLSFDWMPPGSSAISSTTALACKSTLGFFLQRCNAATDRHRGLLGLVDAYLQRCFRSYTTGYNNMNAALERLRRREQLTRDLLLGILFAGVGGAVGGAAGALVSDMVRPAAEVLKAASTIRRALMNATAGAVTDAAKDAAKFIARFPQQLIRGGGGGTGGAAGATPVGPGAGQAGSAQGAGLPGGLDPLTWYSLVQENKSNEEASVAAQIEQWKTITQDGIARGVDATIDWDPVNAVTEITKIDGSSASSLGAAPQAEEYEKSMWEAWIGQYGYTVTQVSDPYGISSGHVVSDNISKELREEMERVAQNLQSRGIASAWLATALANARRRAQAEADRLDREH